MCFSDSTTHSGCRIQSYSYYQMGASRTRQDRCGRKSARRREIQNDVRGEEERKRSHEQLDNSTKWPENVVDENKAKVTEEVHAKLVEALRIVIVQLHEATPRKKQKGIFDFFQTKA